MATYKTTVRSTMSAHEAFAFMADLRNFAVWDPGVVEVNQVQGDGPGPDTVFDVVVKTGARVATLRYRTTNFDAPHTVTVRGKNALFTSVDTVTVVANEHGCDVTYIAELTFNGLLKPADVLLRAAFQKIGDRAAEGLRRSLTTSIS